MGLSVQPRSIRSRPNTLHAFPLQLIAFNSTQLAPVVHRRCRERRAAWRCQHAPCTKSPPITRDDLPRRSLDGLVECTAPPLVQRRVPQEIPQGENPIRPYPPPHANPTSQPASVGDPRALPGRVHAHAARDALSLSQQPYLWSWRRRARAHVARDQRARPSASSIVHSAQTPVHSAAPRRRVHRNPRGGCSLPFCAPRRRMRV